MCWPVPLGTDVAWADRSTPAFSSPPAAAPSAPGARSASTPYSIVLAVAGGRAMEVSSPSMGYCVAARSVAGWAGSPEPLACSTDGRVGLSKYWKNWLSGDSTKLVLSSAKASR
jgi:hypothetical protein